VAVRGWKAAWSRDVGATPVEVCPPNRRRLGAWLRNTGKKAALLGPSKELAAGSAPVALAPGEQFRDDLTWDAWWACTEGKDTTTLAVIEIRR
jgi:hypothetical protein